MRQWLTFKPCDSLFFRGAEPLIAGAHAHNAVMFPPPTSVFAGACVTAALVQKNKKFNEGSIYQGALIGPFLKFEKEFFVPAPANWYQVKNQENAFVKGEPIADEHSTKLAISGCHAIHSWANAEGEVKSILGSWVKLNALRNNKITKPDLLQETLSSQYKENIFDVEERTGIELNNSRTVIDGKLFSARHIRLNPRLEFVWAIDGLDLQPSGILTLGGEQRLGAYSILDKAPEFATVGKTFLATCPMEVNQISKNNLLASGKIVYRGGWDLKKQFYKAMLPYYPAGSVFKENISNSCIPF